MVLKSLISCNKVNNKNMRISEFRENIFQEISNQSTQIKSEKKECN